VILDEVQKVLQLLDEVHWLIENQNFSFILCGSSARKLKRGQSNLLGGRAWRYHMYPLVSAEIEEIDLLKALNTGFIPDHYFNENYQKSLHAYLQDYLKEEVFAEGLTRNMPAFSRFFEAMGYSHGQLTNYTNIARDSGVDAKTIKEYYQILSIWGLSHKAIFVSELSSASIENWMNFELNNFNVRQRHLMSV
jgi:predicted AAA+ superfamily ATPase